MKQKITTNLHLGKTFEDVYTSFIVSKTSLGISASTINNYKYHLRTIGRYLDITMPFDDLSKSDLEKMTVAMRESGLAYNTVATNVRMVRIFLHWCQREGLTTLDIPNFKERETVKETYTDEELMILLKKPPKDASFVEYRTWVIENFLLNCGCCAATVCNIQIRDVDLAAKTVIFRHNKNGKVQANPLCSQMASILSDYMLIRKGAAEDYLFCDQYGGMLTGNALRLSVQHYNRTRGIQKTSIHLFRHTFARKYLIDCGGDAFRLQRLMGHSTLHMTKHYCAIFDADLANNYDKFSPLAQLTKPKERIHR